MEPVTGLTHPRGVVRPCRKGVLAVMTANIGHISSKRRLVDAPKATAAGRTLLGDEDRAASWPTAAARGRS